MEITEENRIAEADLTEPSEDTLEQPTLLFVDDEKNILTSLRRLFRSQGYTSFYALSGAEGLDILQRENIDLVISDMRMPNMDGAEFLGIVAQKWPETLRILLTGFSDMDSTVDAINKGHIYRYISKPWEDNDLKLTVKHALESKFLELERKRLLELTRSQNAQLKDLNTNLEEKVKQRTADLRQTMAELQVTHESLKKSYMSAVKVFSNLVEMGEKSNTGHSRRVADQAHRLAKKSGLSGNDLQDILFAALLHDIGKMGLPDSVTTKPFHTLEQPDRLKMIKHSVIGQAVLMSMEPLQGAAKLIRHHHEQFGGGGYPDGIRGSEIPIGSRILAIANDFDALQIGTLWTQKMSSPEALEFIKRNKGKLYDPDLVEKFLSLEDATIRSASDSESSFKSGDLHPGMVLSRDLLTSDGVLLLSRGYSLDNHLIEKIKRFEESLDYVFIIHVKRKKSRLNTGP